MAGKPERVPPGQPSPAPPSSQNQTPLQNVIVYVSENFPQTYMTQQNVECGEAYSNNINGAGYINGDQSSPSMNNSSQVMKHGKTQEYLSNGFLPVQNNGAYFQTNTNGEGTVVQNNNFNSCQMASNMMNSFSYTNDGGTVVNHGFEGIKCAPEISNHQIAMQQQSSACASNGTSSHMVMDNRESMGVYTIAQSSQNVPVSGMQTFVSNQMDLKQGLDNGSLVNYMTIIGDSNSNNLNVQRCDSVRSDAAESSCSSLSSADCQQESSNNSGAVLAHQNQVQGQVDLNQQHVFQTGHNMQRFMHQNAPQTPPMFSGSNQQVLVNSNMGQHVVQTGVNQPYIPPGEHHIQIVQGNLPADGSHPQFLQSGGSNRAVVGNNSVNCSTPQMTQGTHPQLVATSGSNQLQLFPQNVNQIHVVTSQVSGMQVSGGKQQAQQPHQQQPQQPHQQQQRQHLPLGPPLSQQPPAAAPVAPAAPTTSVHQAVQFVTTVAGNQKMMSPSQCAVTNPTGDPVIESDDVSAIKMGCASPQVNGGPLQLGAAPGVGLGAAAAPAGPAPPSVLVPLGWKRLHSNGSVFYIRYWNRNFSRKLLQFAYKQLYAQ